MSTKPSDDSLVENDLFGNNLHRYCSSCGANNDIFKPRSSNGEPPDFSLKIDVLETTVSSMHKILVIQGQQINHLQEIVSEQAKEISKLNVNFLQQSIINDLRNETLGPYYSQPFPLPDDATPSSLLTCTPEYPNISKLNISTEYPRPDSPSSTHSSVSNSSISTSLPFLLSFDNFQDNDNNISNNYPKANKLRNNHELLSFANDKVKLKTDNHSITRTPKINIIDKIQEFAKIHETTNQDSIPQNDSKRSEIQPPLHVEDEDDSEEEKNGTANNENINADSNSKRVSSQNMKKRKKLKAKKLRFNNIKSTFLAAQRFINPNPETMTTEEIQENERVLQSFKVLKVKLLSFLPVDFFTATFYGREYDLFDNVAVVMAMKYADIHEFSNEKLQSISAGLMDDWNFCAKNWT